MNVFINNILKSWFKKNPISSQIDTTIRDVVYIAGPYAGNEEENTKRAVKVGFIATNKGLASFVPHSCIHMNVYGRDEILKERENGIISTLSIVSYLASLESSCLWVIQSEDGSFSPGTESELIVWKNIKKALKLPENVVIKKYSEWICYE